MVIHDHTHGVHLHRMIFGALLLLAVSTVHGLPDITWTTPSSEPGTNKANHPVISGGMPIGNGKPGQVFHRLSDAWSEHVGVDIVRQIVSGAERTRRAHTTLETGN